MNEPTIIASILSTAGIVITAMIRYGGNPQRLAKLEQEFNEKFQKLFQLEKEIIRIDALKNDVKHLDAKVDNIARTQAKHNENIYAKLDEMKTDLLDAILEIAKKRRGS